MSSGGNAVDGAIAANAVLGVVLPDTCGPGGDLFALICGPGEVTPKALNASGRAGSGADASIVRSEGHTEMPMRSPWRITIPGCVDGWEALLEREGSKSMGEVLAPAISLARNGFPVSAELAMSLVRLKDVLDGQGSAPPLYPGGEPPSPDATLKRPRLADTLEAVAGGGREAFYSGEVGVAITDVTSGVVTAEDLAAPQADWITPIGIDVFGLRAWTIPPNSQGYLTLAAAWIFENFVESADPSDPAYQHAMIEAYRAVAWERDDLVADPSTAPGHPDDLLSSARLAQHLGALRTDTTAPWPESMKAPGGTAFLCTRDSAGTGVALIQSNYHGIGTGLSAGDTGVFLHDRGGGFNLLEGHPNELQPGKRPLHTLSPTIWTRDGGLAAVLGTRGGEYQPQYLIQVAANVFHSGLDLADAQAAPRWTVDGWRPGRNPLVRLEPGHSEGMAHALSARGHDVEITDPWQPGWGPVSVITDHGSHVAAAADPRVSTAAAISQ
jgi:gamma-glutamyltranspeptidase/glutathione hydrolase